MEKNSVCFDASAQSTSNPNFNYATLAPASVPTVLRVDLRAIIFFLLYQAESWPEMDFTRILAAPLLFCQYFKSRNMRPRKLVILNSLQTICLCCYPVKHPEYQISIFSLNLLYVRTRSGSPARHGLHQLAQKSTSTYLPLKTLRATWVAVGMALAQKRALFYPRSRLPI